MKCTEPGVLASSHYYFNIPSGIAKKLYFYCICAGEFYCEAPYHTKRQNYNSFLLMEILDGECIFKQKDKYLTAYKGNWVLLNCYHPHEYYTNNQVHFRFIHFDGNVSEDFVELITKNNGNVLTPPHLEHSTLLNELLAHYSGKTKLTEGHISCCIHQMLCSLMSVEGPNGLYTEKTSALQIALDFIHQNYYNELNVSEIAQTAHLSTYYFSRLFKKEIGYSPYEYLMYYRLEKAKKLLKTSSKAISEISFLTGFKSESNFIYCFHKNIGMSPTQFRNLPF